MHQILTRPVLGIDHTAATSAYWQSTRSAGGGVGAGWWLKGWSAGLLPIACLVNNHQSQEPSAYLMALCSAHSLQIISFHIIGPYLI